jgi:drug/metabolite transporter (DMT)-like permease
MSKLWAGPGLVMLFAVSQALRDVYFSGVFQGVNLFSVILIAFSISMVACGVRAMRRVPSLLTRIRAELPTFIWMNITTAIAWSCYFYGLKTLQPSIVNTLHSAIGPLTVVALGTLGLFGFPKSAISRPERICYIGLAASIAALWWVTLAGGSGIGVRDPAANLTALALLLVSGTSITISLLLSRRMNDRGFDADALTVGRYPLIVMVAVIALLSSDRAIGITSGGQLSMITLGAVLLIALPLYVLQVGIANTAPLTGHVIRSLGPVFIFALELVDQRIAYSTPVLACIVFYSLFSIGANLARGWRR